MCYTVWMSAWSSRSSRGRPAASRAVKRALKTASLRRWSGMAALTLILDDCTSALDAQTESDVLKGLQDMAGSMTVLLVSQRISTVMRTDRILCLDNGRMAGWGTHEELMEFCPMYQEIYHSQIGGGDNGKKKWRDASSQSKWNIPPWSWRSGGEA